MRKQRNERMVALRPSLLDRFVDAPLWNSVPWSSTKILQGKSCQPNVASCSGIDIFLNQEYRERTGTLLTLLGMEPRVSGCEKRKWSIPQ